LADLSDKTAVSAPVLRAPDPDSPINMSTEALLLKNKVLLAEIVVLEALAAAGTTFVRPGEWALAN
jgi:hypothetical protein